MREVCFYSNAEALKNLSLWGKGILSSKSGKRKKIYAKDGYLGIAFREIDEKCLENRQRRFFVLRFLSFQGIEFSFAV